MSAARLPPDAAAAAARPQALSPTSSSTPLPLHCPPQHTHICSDFLPSLPKEHLSRALEVLQLYAQQQAVLNISLTAIGVLHAAGDFLGRCKAAAAAAAAANAHEAAAAAAAAVAAAEASLRRTSSHLLPDAAAAAGPSPGSAPAAPAAAAAAAAGGGGGTRTSTGGGAVVASAASAGRHDLPDAELMALLLKVFTLLRELSCDRRPEVGMRAWRGRPNCCRCRLSSPEPVVC